MRLYKVIFINNESGSIYYPNNNKFSYYTEDAFNYYATSLQRDCYPESALIIQPLDFSSKTLNQLKKNLPGINIVEAPNYYRSPEVKII